MSDPSSGTFAQTPSGVPVRYSYRRLAGTVIFSETGRMARCEQIVRACSKSKPVSDAIFKNRSRRERPCGGGGIDLLANPNQANIDSASVNH